MGSDECYHFCKVVSSLLYCINGWNNVFTAYNYVNEQAKLSGMACNLTCVLGYGN